MPRSIHSSVCAAALMLVATLASAQTPAPEPRPERPSRALFGSWAGETTQSLIASAGAGTAFDSNVVADALGTRGLRTSDLNTNHRGQVGTGSGALAYSMTYDRISLGATAATAVRYYPSMDGAIFRRDRGSVRSSVRLPQNFNATASATYLPFSIAALYPSLLAAGETDLADADFAASTEHHLAWSVGLSTQRQLSRRLQFSADASQSSRERSTDAGGFRKYGAGAGLRYALRRDLDLKAGYHYSQARYDGYDRAGHHLLDVGVDFRRSLSVSRRTMLSFGTGTSGVTDPGGSRTRFRLNGNLALSHDIGRTWDATLTYSRGLRFSESWPEPVQSDAIAVSFGGSISRRLQFSSGASTSTGRVGLNRADSGRFDSYQGSASLSYALSRYVNAGLSYSTYHHKLDSTRILTPGFGPWVDRHRVSVQVSVSAPLYQRARRADATR
jgi:hypothetical protein